MLINIVLTITRRLKQSSSSRCFIPSVQELHYEPSSGWSFCNLCREPQFAEGCHIRKGPGTRPIRADDELWGATSCPKQLFSVPIFRYTNTDIVKIRVFVNKKNDLVWKEIF